MPVDPSKPRKVLVVHGVQSGTDVDLDQDHLVAALIEARLGGLPLQYEVDLYRYENINDRALAKFKRLIGLIAATPLNAIVANTVLDLVGDVVIALADDSTAAGVRAGLRKRIVETYELGQPCYVVAHSLGSIYAFDVINELMKTSGYFERGSRKTWPVQGLVTMGSPIGLGMFRIGSRRRVANLGQGTKWFRWINYWDRTDPVVSGQIFGKHLTGLRIAEKYLAPDLKQGWVIRDRPTDTGKVWIMAHVAYWQNPMVGDGLVDLITN
jgi:hypothetical protein